MTEVGVGVRVGSAFDRLVAKLLEPLENVRRFRCILLLVALACALLTSWAWYPGIFSDDTMAEYLQAIGHERVTDWHPPLLVRLWQTEMAVFGTANLLDATYIIVAAVGLYLSLRLRPCWMSLALYPVLFFSPLFFAIFGYVYKDMLLADLIFLAMGIYLSCLMKGRTPFWTKAGLCVLLLIIAFLRFNAAFLIAPLIVMIVAGWRVSILRLLACLAIVLALVGIARPVNHGLLDAGYDHPEGSLEVFDLGGIARYSLPHDERKIAFQHWDTATQQQKLSACYLPAQWDEYGMWVPAGQKSLHIAWDQWTFQGVFSTRTPPQKKPDQRIRWCMDLGDSLRVSQSVLQNQWIRAVRNHPAAYLHHRWKHFSWLMGHIFSWPTLGDNFIWQQPGYHSLDLVEHAQVHLNWLSRAYSAWLERHGNMIPTNYGAFWVAASLFIFAMSFPCRSAGQKLANCCSFAALMYIIGYFFVGVGSQFRYVLPAAYLVFAALLGRYALRQPLGTHLSFRVGGALALVVLGWSVIS